MNLFPSPDSNFVFLVCGVQMYTLFLIPQAFFEENNERFFNPGLTAWFTDGYT
ncbi:hypothetical protein SAMN05421797_1061 [Maribacter ulvicola]|uniref:Uncharacterized protein n=1 Tax=Maribacter ulvicola TaxID=228959 RepID=A0A1N6XYV5_9FLAO|nr:hypothetical protein SAMN05421797_1061 [Maribacter ulvicola]